MQVFAKSQMEEILDRYPEMLQTFFVSSCQTRFFNFELSHKKTIITDPPPRNKNNNKNILN